MKSTLPIRVNGRRARPTRITSWLGAVILACLLCAPAHAGGIDWVRAIGTPGTDVIYALTTDPAGNLIAGGMMDGRGWVAKYNRARELVWERQIRGPGDSRVLAVAADGVGNVFATGSFTGFSDFGTGLIGSAGYPTVVAADLWVASYGSQFGEPRWARTMGSGRDGGGFGLAVTGSEDVVVTGTAAGRYQLSGACPLVASTSSSADVLLMRLHGASGACQWVRMIGSGGEDAGHAIAGPDAFGALVVVGRFQGTVDFGGGRVLTSSGLSDAFALKIKVGQGGLTKWARRFGGPGDDVARAVAVNAWGQIAVAGRASPGTELGANQGGWDAFVALLGPGGGQRWVISLGGAQADEAYGVAFARDSASIFVTGAYQGTADFRTGLLWSSGQWDGFIAEASIDGQPLWASSFGGAGVDIGMAVTVDGSGQAIVGGYYSTPSALFGPAGVLMSPGQTQGVLIGVR